MNGAELIRRIRRYARRAGIPFVEDARRGKGDHRTIRLGDRVSIVGDLRRELKTGMVHSICKQLGIDLGDL